MASGKHCWKNSEIIALLKAVEKIGRNWEAIHVQVLPNISSQGLRNMYYKILREQPEFFQEYPQLIVKPEFYRGACKNALRPENSGDEAQKSQANQSIESKTSSCDTNTDEELQCLCKCTGIDFVFTDLL